MPEVGLLYPPPPSAGRILARSGTLVTPILEDPYGPLPSGIQLKFGDPHSHYSLLHQPKASEHWGILLKLCGDPLQQPYGCIIGVMLRNVVYFFTFTVPYFLNSRRDWSQEPTPGELKPSGVWSFISISNSLGWELCFNFFTKLIFSFTDSPGSLHCSSILTHILHCPRAGDIFSWFGLAAEWREILLRLDTWRKHAFWYSLCRDFYLWTKMRIPPGYSS